MPINQADQLTLLQVARSSIEYGLNNKTPLPIDLSKYPETLHKIRATFVTLYLKGDLQGCIGTLESYRTLIEDVAKNSFAAAFQDPRFSPVKKEDLKELKISISILSTPEPLSFGSEEDLLRKIRPGIDGLILSKGTHRGTFLPAVWETLSDPKEFLNHLKQKAGLSKDYWSDEIIIQRYSSESIKEA